MDSWNSLQNDKPDIRFFDSPPQCCWFKQWHNPRMENSTIFGFYMFIFVNKLFRNEDKGQLNMRQSNEKYITFVRKIEPIIGIQYLFDLNLILYYDWYSPRFILQRDRRVCLFDFQYIGHNNMILLHLTSKYFSLLGWKLCVVQKELFLCYTITDAIINFWTW